MKFVDFLKDRFFLYSLCAFTWVCMVVFMTAFHVSEQLIIIVSTLLAVSLVCGELWEFFRKKRYYDSIVRNIEELDKKYLISEMTDEPEFLDGQIFQYTLEQAGKSMAENVAGYRRENAEFREFIELWVHEVKLPLSSLQLILHNNRSSATEKALEQLRKVDGYADTVLYYARSENAEKDYIIKQVDLKKAVGSVAIRNREDLSLNGFTLNVHDIDLKVLTDGKWLEYILNQLISNSIKYISESNKNPEIEIYSEDLQDSVRLFFRDNGIGISEDDLPYIFEKSFTGKNGHRHAKSTGMGLYIAKNLCTKLGHGIECRSEEGVFTEFVITFYKNHFFDVTKL